MKLNPTPMVSVDKIEGLIRTIRGQKVILDSDLAQLYGVETKAFNRAVKRNSSRFPRDFMFQLTQVEFEKLRYQIGTSSSLHGLDSDRSVVLFGMKMFSIVADHRPAS